MGKTADLTVVQKKFLDNLHEEAKPQKVSVKEAGCSQRAVSNHIHRTLRIRRVWWEKGSQARSDLRQEAVHQEPPQTVSRVLSVVICNLKK